MNEYENAIEVHGVSKNYKDFGLDNISFDVPKGCIMGFIGQNGAGKTTTIRSMLNITKIDSGEIRLLGLDHVQDEAEIKKRIAVVFDDLPFHDMFTAKDIAKIFEGMYPEWNNIVYCNYINRFELPYDKKIGKFSKGMKMKLQIACALSHNAELLIMDEATAGLDPVVRDEILHIFMEYLQDGERSILMSSHITSDLEKIADMVTFINKGRILLTGYKDDIIERHGIIKCGFDRMTKIDPDDIVSIRMNNFGAEIMVNNKEKALRECSDCVIDSASIDDIMLFYVHRYDKEWLI
ncbi:ABC transporter ATP-binding protein [Ruminococcus albus]|uniref:ABC-2 type transport system ATP-binding protein n=1 Tax=Ruminococcus albus TaxID=1264 RepID=A0A1I1ECW9_RUMAL|nr:ABC transporter ATP-binding protein [Ruminococcus albus]SFB84606.1 ABC-2 type transport system ATP-binding protein [Ruminococcus albus]